MDVFSPGPFRAASLLWTPRLGTVALTVVCKATFQLRPGESPLAAEQDLPNEDENHWNDDPSRSLCSPCDLVPRKPRADVLLVGNAFAPRLSPVRSLLARLVVGGIDKSIEVFGERSFSRDGQLREGAGVTKMPIRWERAAGGPETRNPVGVRAQGPPDLHGNVPIPNLQPAGFVLGRPADFIPPVGFGPIAASWPERREKLGRHAGAWPAPGWTERPLPEDLDPGYFNAAPRDQQVEGLRDDERIVLENLHPEHPRLSTALPGIRPRVMLERPGRPPQALEMRADTLWIDTDRGLCTLTWRGQALLDHRNEPVTARVTADHTGHDDAAQTMVPLRGAAPAMPFAGGRSGESPMSQPMTGTMLLSPTDLEEVSVDEEPPAAPREAAVETVFLTRPAAPAPAAMPFVAAPARVPVPPPPAPVPLRPADLVPPPRPQSIGERASVPGMSPNLLAATGAGPMGSVLDASNAAAAPALRRPDPEPAPAPPAVEARPRVAPREVLKLLWFDPRSVPRIRKHTEWRVILAELELRLLDEGDAEDDAEAPEGAGDEPNPKLRRDVFEVLAKARAIGPEGVKLAMNEAIGDDGKFEPPLALLAGELELPFDELATLKATAAAASPFASADKQMKDQLEVVEELLKTPWLQGSGSIAEGLTEKIKAVFAQGKRPLGPEYLASHTERMLLEQRCYQMRTVFGKRWIRSLLGGSGVPVYVPEALRDELPMFKRVKVRLIGEMDMQEDQYESGGCAVKVVALGRVMG